MQLHSLVDSNWIVPWDENLESSLFLLEKEEKEYETHLSEVANITASEPIGTRTSTIPSSIGADSTDIGSLVRRMVSSPTRPSRTPRSSRSNRAGTPRVSPRRGSGVSSMSQETSHEYYSATRRSVEQRGRESSVPRPSPIEFSRSHGGTGWMRSFEHDMDQSSASDDEDSDTIILNR